MRVKTGIFDSRSTSGSQSITGVGFTPVGLILIGAGAQSLNVSQDNYLNAMGATDGTHQWSSYIFNQHASAFSGAEFSTAACYKQSTNSGTNSATIASFDSDGFTLAWAITDPQAYKISYIAFSDVSFYVGSFTSNASTGVKHVTGIPFTPKAIIAGGYAIDSGAGWKNFNFSVLTALGDPTGWTQGVGIGTRMPSHYQWVYTYGITLMSRGQYAYWGSLEPNGFSYNVDNAYGISVTQGYIALGGDTLKAWSGYRNVNRAVSGGIYTESSLGFEPAFALSVDHCGITGDSNFRTSLSLADQSDVQGKSHYLYSPTDWIRNCYSQLNENGAAITAENPANGVSYFSSLRDGAFDWTYSGFTSGNSPVGFLLLGEEAAGSSLSALGVG